MPALSLCFQVHQPYRLRPFSFFDVGQSTEYFDSALVRRGIERAAREIYLPLQEILERVVKKHKEEFQCAFLITGTAIEQMRESAPMALAGFARLAGYSMVEILGSTYYQSLAALLDSPEEFVAQTSLHREVLKREFGVDPKVFFHLAQLHSDRVAELLQQLGFSGIILDEISEGENAQLAHTIYRAPSAGVRIMACKYSIAQVSELGVTDVSRKPACSPESLMQQLQAVVAADDVVCLRIDCAADDMEKAPSEMLASLEGLVELVLRTPGWSFVTPSRALERNESLEALSRTRQEALGRIKSSGSVWLGNSMQRKAFQELYEEPLMSKADRQVWGRLQASDYFKYMSATGASCAKSDRPHAILESPYDAFITYMNILRALRHEVEKVGNNAPFAQS